MTGYAEIARAYRDAALTLQAQWRNVDMERRGALQPSSAASGVRFTWLIFENLAS
ncbi:MAG: hypothetical protein AAFQ54_09135 [Pseudomonadota bacterium]